MTGKRSLKEESDVESDQEGTSEKALVPVNKPAGAPPIPGKQTDADGNAYFEISAKRRATVRSFGGVKLVDIREMYTDKATGELKPGKKGISLSEEQFLTLVNAHGAIAEALNKVEVGASGSKTAKVSKPKKEATKPAPRKKAKKADSDEE